MMEKCDLNDIIECLTRTAKILRNQPDQAIKELHQISRQIDYQVPYRDGHMQRVCFYALKIGKQLGLTEAELVILEAAALLHDFGKIGINEAILVKINPLTGEERIEIQKHVLRGYYILQGFSELVPILDGIRHHHEQFDGSGYPEQLAGENISLHGRIIALADAYDAITSQRPYRNAKTKEYAINELKKYSGKQFDPKLVEIFINILKDIE
jgi:HD-GYP domain-containing protein (c-di-GMP phosphodiesterase class II)